MAEMTDPVMDCVLVCPSCGHTQRARMPADACQFFYECVQCHTVLRPKPGDCCVFCSYGSVQCPPKQLTQGRCSDGGACSVS